MAAPLAPSSHQVTRDELRASLRAGRVALVDVLPREAFAEGHIPGSINLPVAEIPARAREVLPDPSREIIVYCSRFT